MKNKATINLINLAANSEEFAYEKLIINNNEYKIGKEKSINIDFDDFETEMGSKIVKCEFIGVSNIRYRYFEAVEGDNNGFLFPEFGFIRDVVFPDDSKHEVKIMHKKKIIYEGHFFNRLLLINVNDNYDIWIDNIIVTESIIHITACGSAQVVPYDLENHFFCYKEISEIDYKEFFKFYDLKKDDAENFFKSIQRLVNIIPINLVDCQLFKDKINDEALNDLFLLKLNVSKSIASKYYNKEEYFNFICNCSLYYILSYLKDKISDPKIYLSIFKFFTDFKSEILKDSSLNYYNKSIVMMEFSYWMKNIENPAKFHNIKFKYYVRNKCKKNSILNSSLSFLEEFIDKLDENSPFLEPLIFIDSGYYIYNNDIVYGHGLISKELLKSHLKNVIPEVIFVYNDQKEIDDIALSNKANGAIELNLACNFFSKFKNISLDENVEDDKLRKNLSLKLVFVFLHEIFGHKKGGFSTRGKFINSPRIFYDKDKKAILRLTNKFSLEKGDNYINIIKGSNNSDSGYFLEYFLGQCDCGYTIAKIVHNPMIDPPIE